MGIDVIVAIVTYRSARLTVDCLSSVEAERTTTSDINIRAIVVDNASGDAKLISEAIDKRNWWSWVTLITAPRNGGFAYGNNLALQHANANGPAKYFHMLNPDTVVRKGAIAELVRFLDAHSNIGIAGGSFENVDGSEWPKAFRFPSLLSELEDGLQFGLASRILRRWVVPQLMTPVAQSIDWVVGASMMIRWTVFQRIGGFDDNYFLYFEETDFCFRAKKAGLSTWYVPASRVMHIGGQSTDVSNHKIVPKRLPEYWFESRRRYFVINHGMAFAVAADIVALVSHGFGSLKRLAQGRQHQTVPHFLADLLRHSVLWRRNRLAVSIVGKDWPQHQMPEGLVWSSNHSLEHSTTIADLE